MPTRRLLNTTLAFCCSLALNCQAQGPNLGILNHNHSVLDAHNCYPYEARWADRVTRALQTGFPVGIEQDLAWYVDPTTGKGRVVVTHKAETNGSEPALRDYFFERVRPIVERALRDNDSTRWPLIVVHFDFKDNQAPLLRAVWQLLGEYESWITTAPKLADLHQLAPMKLKPLLVLTEDPDAQEQIFSTAVPTGGTLRLFGSAHTHSPVGKSKEETSRLLATAPPEQLLSDPPTNYRRWWNNSWHEVEEGGQPRAGLWTEAGAARLGALVNRAHQLGYWIRFYTLDGFSADEGRDHGWFESYNFGSAAAVRERWTAAIKAGVDLIATDQYEDLAPLIRR